MKKPITIGVIAVIAAILVTSAVDYSAIGAKPTHEIHAQGIARDNGEIVCSDGSTKTTDQIIFDLRFSEELLGNKGQFLAIGSVGSNENFDAGGILYNGSIDSQSYMFQGIGNVHFRLGNLCGLESNEIYGFTVWGECGRDVVINFETDLGVSGTSIGTVVCV